VERLTEDQGNQAPEYVTKKELEELFSRGREGESGFYLAEQEIGR